MSSKAALLTIDEGLELRSPGGLDRTDILRRNTNTFQKPSDLLVAIRVLGNIPGLQLLKLKEGPARSRVTGRDARPSPVDLSLRLDGLFAWSIM